MRKAFVNASTAGPLPGLQLYEPEVALLYSIEVAARLTNVPRRLIAVYCRHGLVSPVMDPELGGWYFNDEALRRLCRIEQLRTECGMNLTAIRLITGLMEEVEHLQREIRFLRTR